MSRKCLIVRNSVNYRSAPDKLRSAVISFLSRRGVLDINSFFNSYVIRQNRFFIRMFNLLKEKSISFEDFLRDSSLCRERDLNIIYRYLKKNPINFLDALKNWSESKKKKRYSHINRVTKRCNVSGRKNAIGLLGICRVQVRELHAAGALPGLLKY